MKLNTSTVAILLTFVTMFSGVFTVHADETYFTGSITSYAEYRFNNENWDSLPHPMVAEFTVRDDGSAFGLTETGVSFVQYNVPNDVGIRVQRFEIQDHYHYIVEGEIANTIEELSARLALAYQTLQGSV
jgi:hypothetical protein